ncbi:MAG: hypothetical protein LBD63_01015 [Mycoplasmataceae bacterium]|jgi:hypothetical protein|nr:hypothetical protein [Mycoplasmataceae bacterium]
MLSPIFCFGFNSFGDMDCVGGEVGYISHGVVADGGEGDVGGEVKVSY